MHKFLIYNFLKSVVLFWYYINHNTKGGCFHNPNSKPPLPPSKTHPKKEKREQFERERERDAETAYGELVTGRELEIIHTSFSQI